MIHFEVLVEDSSGEKAVTSFLKKIAPENTTYKVIAYKGIGRIPKGMQPGSDPRKRILLDQLPRLIRGYGKTFASDAEDYRRSVVIVCDLDTREKVTFEREINNAIMFADPKPNIILCLAIEEGEAWLLGDPDAVLEAYPRADRAALNSYIPDSICGTWEKLADLTYPGGSKALKPKGFVEIGRQKHQWAERIAPKVDPDRSKSPSFRAFAEKIRDFR